MDSQKPATLPAHEFRIYTGRLHGLLSRVELRAVIGDSVTIAISLSTSAAVREDESLFEWRMVGVFPEDLNSARIAAKAIAKANQCKEQSQGPGLSPAETSLINDIRNAYEAKPTKDEFWGLQ